MASRTMNFTQASVDKLEIEPGVKRQSVRDTSIPGLILDIRDTGSKSFYVYRRVGGRPERIFIARTSELSVEKARKQAQIILGQIALGINPQEEKRQVRTDATFGQFFRQYMDRYSKPHKKTWKADEQDGQRFLSPLFSKKLNNIRKTDIQHLHEQIFLENGLYQANKILNRIKAIYHKAQEWGWKGTNPAIGIKRYKEKSRERFIQPDEMPILIRVIEEETDQTLKDFLWMLLLTGARKTNTLQMRWEQILWDRNEWSIPTTKNGDPLSVPLVDRAIEILQRRKKATNSQWVFPMAIDDSGNNEDRHFLNFRPGWNRIREKATLILWLKEMPFSKWLKEAKTTLQIPENETGYYQIFAKAEKDKVEVPSQTMMDLRLHDIRRTLGSYQALTGASLQIIGKSLGHKSMQSTQVYARLNLDPVRQAVEKATQVMLST